MTELHEYVGAVHLHSCYSDGSGTLREIAAAGGRAGLDYVVVTDHDTLRPREDGWQGWRDGVLLVPGVEITCRDRSHVVALGAAEVANLQFKPLRRVLFDLQNQGAAAFVAHAHPAHIMGISLKAGELLDWDIPGFTGVELWSFMHDICNGLMPWRIPSFIYTWRRRIRGPHPDTVAHWDRVTRHRRFAAIGSLDNHAMVMPVFGKQVLSYEEGFRTLRTHVLTREWTGPAVLRVHSPAPAALSLLRNGAVMDWTTGTDLEHRAEEAGVYRVEARFEGRPWVYTNPVYLRPVTK
ncbi:MAG: hypothetical protein NTU94_08715 [Planctomycetota bacterium]|nr:hypothetical protein [Planctomycetota bacterium]